MFRTYLLGVVTLLFAVGLAACDCPPDAIVRRALLTAGSDRGFVVCGHSEPARNGVITGSELEIFACDAPKALFWFGGVQTARIERRGTGLRVVEIAHWPFGKNWTWIDMPVLEWTLEAGMKPPAPRAIAPEPAITAAQVDAFLERYRALLRAGSAADEEIVGRLFAAAMSGNRTAADLFRTMERDAHLDGGAGEAYKSAQELFRRRWPAPGAR